MGKYVYVVSNEKGIRARGVLQASSEGDASEKLRERGDLIISLHEQNKRKWNISKKPHMGLEDRLMFAKHLATMMGVGITVTEALEILKSQELRKNNQQMYENMIRMIGTGQSLANSLREYENVFSEIFVNMVATGEKSGTLEKVLSHLEVQLEKEYELRKKVISAFIYPAVIVFVTLLVVTGIIVFLMPKITDIFRSFDADLPLPTRVLIGINEFIQNHPLRAVGEIGGGIAFFITIARLKALKPFWDAVVLRIPVFGRILKYANLARFSRTMNSLLQSGVPITEALQITESMLVNKYYKEAVHRTWDKVEKGGKLGEALKEEEKLFPPLLTSMLFIGESSGSLEKTTGHLADLYEKNVDNITKNLSVLLEPMLLVFMGLMVGGVALSIILPIYQLPNLISAS